MNKISLPGTSKEEVREIIRSTLKSQAVLMESDLKVYEFMDNIVITTSVYDALLKFDSYNPKIIDKYINELGDGVYSGLDLVEKFVKKMISY